MNDKVNLYICS